MVGGRWAPSEPIGGSTGLEGFEFENRGRDLSKGSTEDKGILGSIVDWALGDKIEGAASGGDLRSDGLLRVHKDETVVPASLTRSSVLNSLLKDVSTVGKSGETIINVYSSPKNDFSGMKIASDVDVEKLLKRIESMIESGSTKAVKDALGQRRT